MRLYAFLFFILFSWKCTAFLQNMRARRCRLLFPVDPIPPQPSLARRDFALHEATKPQLRSSLSRGETYKTLECLFSITGDALSELQGTIGKRRSLTDAHLEERSLATAAMRHGVQSDFKSFLGKVNYVARKVLPYRWRWRFVHKNAMAYAIQLVFGSRMRLPIKDDNQKDAFKRVREYALPDQSISTYFLANRERLDIGSLRERVEQDVFEGLSRALDGGSAFDRMESLENMPTWALAGTNAADEYSPIGAHLAAVIDGFFTLLGEWEVAFPSDEAVPLLLRGIVRHAMKLELDMHTTLPSSPKERRIPVHLRQCVRELIDLFAPRLAYPIELVKPVNRQFDVMCYYLAIEIRSLLRRRKCGAENSTESRLKTDEPSAAADAMRQLVFTGICEVNHIFCRLGGMRDVITALCVLVKMLTFDTLARIAEERGTFTSRILKYTSPVKNRLALIAAIRRMRPAANEIRSVLHRVTEDVFGVIEDCLERNSMGLLPTLSAGHLQTHMIYVNAKPSRMKVHYPIQIEPGRWGSDYSSPYIHIRALITTGRQCMEPKSAELDPQGHMRTFLNYIGAVPFRLDRNSVFVQEEGLRQGFAFDRIPAAFGGERPASPDEHRDTINQRSWTHHILSNLRHCMGIERFHVPHQLDFRGRVYPLPQMFSIASIRQFRAILRFADKTPLGAPGFRWLKIHAANMFGLTKRSFAERVQFVNEHMDIIQRCAKAPFSENFHFWGEGENALEFLAACQELSAAVDSGSPEAFASDLPVQVDGSANGLQHYSAISRDPLGAAAVNMTPSDAPQDVYTHVLREMLREITLDNAGGLREAGLILGSGHGLDKNHLRRSTIKRAIMTQVYGVTQFGMRKMIRNELASQNASHLLWGAGEIAALAAYLTTKLSASLGVVFARTDEARSWLKNTAAVAFMIQSPKTRAPLQFTTPLGFSVVLPYETMRKRTVYDYNSGAVTIPEHLGTPSRKCISSFSANFVHSLDATHLAMTALEMQRRGFPMTSVHDCYWCHAANMDTLAAVTRETFVKLYAEHDPLAALHRDWSARYEQELRAAGLYFPPPPAKGSYVLENVLKAPYFFA